MIDCAWCERAFVPKREHGRFCSVRCRQASNRFGAECVSRRRATQPIRIAYADPPYPGQAHYYADQKGHHVGEVNHSELLEHLAAFDGWALSTSARALPEVLALCAAQGLDVRIGAWFRGARGNREAKRPRAAWEPVIYRGGRALDGSPPDALIQGVTPRLTDPRRVIGAKPAAFAFWLFELLGALPGDRFSDFFPGSGGMGRAWAEYEARQLDASRSTSGRVGEDLATRRAQLENGSGSAAGRVALDVGDACAGGARPVHPEQPTGPEDLGDASTLQPRRVQLIQPRRLRLVPRGST